MEQERRQYLRAKVSWPVTIRTEKETLERVTYNISPIGAFICGLSPLELHEVVDMTISASDLQIEVKAKVVWTSNQVPPEADMPRGMGVEFINISDEHRELISSLVAADAEPSDSKADEMKQGLMEEQTSIGDQSSTEKQPVEGEEKKHAKKESALGPPRNCPEGHKHISWSIGDEHIFCWDCNRRYPLTACFKPPEREPSDPERPNDQPGP
ncbi:MAG: PilZ domain-containing protein [Syntrophobacterales bacterium]|jgi:hypothetical protein